MCDLATKFSLGMKLTDLGYGTGLYPTSPYTAVKVPVFSFEKLTAVSYTHLECEKFINEHFDVVNLSKIPIRKIPQITDEPLIWRYFVTPLHTKLCLLYTSRGV